MAAQKTVKYRKWMEQKAAVKRRIWRLIAAAAAGERPGHLWTSWADCAGAAAASSEDRRRLTFARSFPGVACPRRAAGVRVIERAACSSLTNFG